MEELDIDEGNGLRISKSSITWFKILIWSSSVILSVIFGAVTFGEGRADLQNQVTANTKDINSLKQNQIDLSRALADYIKENSKTNNDINVAIGKVQTDVGWLVDNAKRENEKRK